MTAIFRFLDLLGVDFWERLSKEDRAKITRNAEAAAARMKARGDDSETEVQDIRRRRRALEKEPA